MKKVVLNKEERVPNEVDGLLERVYKIQASCEHDFRLTKEPKLAKSLVDGVYVGYTAGPTLVDHSETKIILVCLKCSLKKDADIWAICPCCLWEMQKGSLTEGHTPQPQDGRYIFSREYYFGEEYIYYSVRLYRCPSCGFTVACDEWNQ